MAVHYYKAISQYVIYKEVQEILDNDFYKFYLDICFSTLTNVNFDENRFIELLEKAAKYRDKFKAQLEKTVPRYLETLNQKQ